MSLFGLSKRRQLDPSAASAKALKKKKRLKIGWKVFAILVSAFAILCLLIILNSRLLHWWTTPPWPEESALSSSLLEGLAL